MPVLETYKKIVVLFLLFAGALAVLYKYIIVINTLNGYVKIGLNILSWLTLILVGIITFIGILVSKDTKPSLILCDKNSHYYFYEKRFLHDYMGIIAYKKYGPILFPLWETKEDIGVNKAHYKNYKVTSGNMEFIFLKNSTVTLNGELLEDKCM